MEAEMLHLVAQMGYLMKKVRLFHWLRSTLLKYLSIYDRLTASLENTSNVVRPQIGPRGSSKSKKRSSLRVSFGPGGTSMNEDDDSTSSAVFTPKKSSLSRQAVEKNALRKALASSISSDHLPIRQTNERPSYSADHLNELKGSTPSTPKDLKYLSDEDDSIKELDIATKFGTNLAIYQDSAIPTDAEIREKKERRARHAKEEEYIHLSDNEDEDGNEISLLPRTQKPETRLVRDDEDIAEGFDEFVEDGRIALGQKAEREQKRRHEAEMRDLINEAEGYSNDDSDDSDAERRAAYEVAQTRSGMDGLQKNGTLGHQPRRPRTPPKITPLPSLSSCLERMQASLATLKHSRAQKGKKMEELAKEKLDIAAREVEIQRLLKEAGENYEKLRAEAGIPAGDSANQNGQKLIGEANSGRGLEEMGNTPMTDPMSP